MARGSSARSLELKGLSTKSAGAWRPGGRPMPTRSRAYFFSPPDFDSAAEMERSPLWPWSPPLTSRRASPELEVELVVHRDEVARLDGEEPR